MSAPDAGSAAAVTKPSNCDRIDFNGKDKHVAKHSWRFHSVPGKVRLVTKLIDNRHLRTFSPARLGQDRGLLPARRRERSNSRRSEGRTPRTHMFKDGCGEMYKGRRNFRFLADNVRQIDFFVDHHFAATSHFKGCHNGLGGFLLTTP